MAGPVITTGSSFNWISLLHLNKEAVLYSLIFLEETLTQIFKNMNFDSNVYEMLKSIVILFTISNFFYYLTKYVVNLGKCQDHFIFTNNIVYIFFDIP